MNPFLAVASSLALEAGARIMELRKSPLVRTRKPDHSLVTNADHEADRIIRQGLRKAFPDHTILTEESGMEGSPRAEYVWVVDPLDGTRAYASDVTGYSVMIGLLKAGKPVVGVVYDPLEGHFYEAASGEGTFYQSLSLPLPREGGGKGNGPSARLPLPSWGRGGERVHVSTRKDFRKMPVITSTGFPEPLYESLRKELRGPWLPALNSVGVKVGVMVRQLADIYLNHHSVHYWDTCAPQIILEEAGGIITFTDGQPLFYDLTSNLRHAGPTIASNGVCHSDLLKKVGPLMRPAAHFRSDEKA